MPMSHAPSRSALVVRWLAFVLFIVLFFGHVALGWLGANRIIGEWFTPSDAASVGDPSVSDLPIETVQYPSPLGPMDAWLIDGSRSEWIIYVHGEDAGLEQALPLATELASSGYHQLIISYRNDPGQPEDPSGRPRYGVTEWADLDAAIAWAQDQGADAVSVVASSSGASIALEHMLKTRSGVVRSFVFDSPMVDLGGTIDATEGARRILGVPMPFTVTEVAKFATGLRISVNWRQIDYPLRVSTMGVSTLIFHGSDDDVVPFATTKEMESAAPLAVQVVEVDGGHHLIFQTEPADTWAGKVKLFIASQWN